MTTWTIAQLERTTENSGVITAHWVAFIAEDINGDPVTLDSQDEDVVAENEVDRPEAYFAETYGSCQFTPNSSSDDFIPFEQLTEQQVLGWVWSAIDKSAVESNLTSQIAEQKSPQTQLGVPW